MESKFWFLKTFDNWKKLNLSKEEILEIVVHMHSVLANSYLVNLEIKYLLEPKDLLNIWWQLLFAQLGLNPVLSAQM